MKQMGLTSYRFSISWPRILPDGLGPVNPAGVQHYRQFITDLKAAGIQPMLTLYHWDMPASLAAAGGWENRASIDWFQHYAEVVFANFADQVDLFVLVNEPAIERDGKTAIEDHLAGASLYRQPTAPNPDSPAEIFRPESMDSAFNGPVRPDQFRALLNRIRTEYGNPIVFITENGAGSPATMNSSTAPFATYAAAATSSATSPPCSRPSPMAPTCAATMSGPAMTTSNGPAATSLASA